MLDWINERLSIREVLTQPSFPRGRASWQYFPGFVVFILFTVQCLTGALLGSDPTMFLNDSFIYKFHQVITKLLLLFVTLQFLRNILVGSYQNYREFHWIILLSIFVLIWINYFLGSFFCPNTQEKSIFLYETLSHISFFNLPQKINPQTMQKILAFHILVIPMITYMFFLMYIWLLERTGLESRNKD